MISDYPVYEVNGDLIIQALVSAETRITNCRMMVGNREMRPDIVERVREVPQAITMRNIDPDEVLPNILACSPGYHYVDAGLRRAAEYYRTRNISEFSVAGDTIMTNYIVYRQRSLGPHIFTDLAHLYFCYVLLEVATESARTEYTRQFLSV